MRPDCPPPAGAFLLGAVLLLTPALAGVAIASPAPIPVCGLCGQQLAYTSQNEDVPLDVERSTATMQVHRNGTATWTVRNRIGNETTAQRLRADQTLAEHLVRETLETRGISAQDPIYRSARVTANGTLVARYQTPDVATRTNGVLRVDYFRNDPGSYVYIDLGADRLTVVGPPDTVVTSGLPGASVEGNRLTLTEWDAGGDGPYLVFAPEDASFASIGTFLATTGPNVSTVLGNLGRFVVLPAVVLTLLVLGVTRVVDRLAGEASADRARRYGTVVAGLGLLAAVHPWYAGPAPLLGSYDPPLLAGGVAAFVVGAVATGRPQALDLREQFLTVVAGIALGGLAVATVGGVVPDGYVPRSVLEPTLTGGLVLLAVPVGHGFRHADRSLRRRLLALPALAIALGSLLTISVTSVHRLAMASVVILVGFSLIASLVAMPLFALGMVLPDGGDTDPGKHSTRSRASDARRERSERLDQANGERSEP